jgi:hypothetical protein
MAVASNNTTLTPKPALPPAADPATAETRKAAERSGLKGEQGLKQYQDSVRQRQTQRQHRWTCRN